MRKYILKNDSRILNGTFFFGKNFLESSFQDFFQSIIKSLIQKKGHKGNGKKRKRKCSSDISIMIGYIIK
jgi:hypothetical protein